MAIKRVLLPVSGDGNFEPLADMAFLIGEMFSAQVMGLFVQSPGVVVPLFDGVVSPEQVRTLIETAQGRAARAQSMFKASAERFPHVKSAFHSLIGDVETLFIRALDGWLTFQSSLRKISLKMASGVRAFGLMCRTQLSFAAVVLCYSCHRMHPDRTSKQL